MGRFLCKICVILKNTRKVYPLALIDFLIHIRNFLCQDKKCCHAGECNRNNFALFHKPKRRQFDQLQLYRNRQCNRNHQPNVAKIYPDRFLGFRFSQGDHKGSFSRLANSKQPRIATDGPVESQTPLRRLAITCGRNRLPAGLDAAKRLNAEHGKNKGKSLAADLSTAEASINRRIPQRLAPVCAFFSVHLEATLQRWMVCGETGRRSANEKNAHTRVPEIRRSVNAAQHFATWPVDVKNSLQITV
jgi:hypothetical protein